MKRFMPYPEKLPDCIMEFVGCPSIAITPKGRIFVSYFIGGNDEPDMENYNVLIYSDDQGETWSEPILAVNSDTEELIHAFDIELWLDSKGKLHITWIEDKVKKVPDNHLETLKERNISWTMINNGEYIYQDNGTCIYHKGFVFSDWDHETWETVCENPHDEILIFSQPRLLYKGLRRNKPIETKSSRIIADAYSQNISNHRYAVSDDDGETWKYVIGGKKCASWCDESMCYEMKDGTIRFFERCDGKGFISESISKDNGETFTDAKLTDIKNPGSRFYIGRTPLGNICLVNNDHKDNRNNMTLYLSEDDGITWKHKLLIDERDEVSYPATDYYDGKIFFVYDHERIGAKEIILGIVKEKNILEDDPIVTFKTVIKL